MAGEPTLISSVQRALHLVDRVASASHPVSAKVLARELGLSLGTTYNLARTLVHEGYLSAEHDGYVLGPHFPALAGTGDGVMVAHGREILKAVRDELKVPAYLTRYDDGEISVVDIVDDRTCPRLDLWVGVQDSAHATAFGKQILATLGVEERLDYLSRHALADLTPHTISSPRVLLHALEHGATVTVDHQEYALGYTCVAVPVVTPTMIGAIAVSAPAERQDQVEARAVTLQRAAGRLSLRLSTVGG
jgi:DNA-binding IclR family transcriptional regulator